MPHQKLPEQRLSDVYSTLDDIAGDLPPEQRKELAKAQNTVSRVRTDIVQWREYVDE